jgi:hypothetical protein
VQIRIRQYDIDPTVSRSTTLVPIQYTPLTPLHLKERTEHLVLFCRNIVPLRAAPRAGFELKLKSLLESENVPDQDPQEKANDIEHR